MAAGISLAGVSPGQSETLTPSRTTVRSTDYTPASGETFLLYGAMWSEGEEVPATIRVKTCRDGKWVQLSGAVMHTNPDDGDMATARKTIKVNVH